MQQLDGQPQQGAGSVRTAEIDVGHGVEVGQSPDCPCRGKRDERRQRPAAFPEVAPPAESEIERGENNRGDQGILARGDREAPENQRREVGAHAQRTALPRVRVFSKRAKSQTRRADVAQQRGEHERGLEQSVLSRQPRDRGEGMRIYRQYQTRDGGPEDAARKQQA